MRAVSVSDFRANIASLLDEVVDVEQRLIVTRSGRRNVVVLSERDWNSIEETLYLLSNPHNALRLAQSIIELRQGKGEMHDLIETAETAAE